VQPHPPGPGVRQPSDSAHTQDIARTLASLKSKFPAAVIWFGRATGRWWAMAGAGCRAQLLEAESPSALTAALARLAIAGLPLPDSTELTRTRPQAALQASRAPYGAGSASGRPLDWTPGDSPSP
jgi:hypothetical protein